jgi:excisionase family DNA binding protein
MTAARDRAKGNVKADVPRVAWSVREFAAATGISIDTTYRLLDRGEVGWFQLGGEKRIPNTELERLLAEAEGRRSA